MPARGGSSMQRSKQQVPTRTAAQARRCRGGAASAAAAALLALMVISAVGPAACQVGQPVQVGHVVVVTRTPAASPPAQQRPRQQDDGALEQRAQAALEGWENALREWRGAADDAYPERQVGRGPAPLGAVFVVNWHCAWPIGRRMGCGAAHLVQGAALLQSSCSETVQSEQGQQCHHYN
eukprot:359009-Chlamydomonas_euryale.AAC.2